MIIRPYQPADDPALMAIEYRSPRGASNPFVHWRRRFADRARLFADHQIFVLDDDGIVAGCVAIAVKQVMVSGGWLPLGYLFDLRIDPVYRRFGWGTVLTDYIESYAIDRGIVGVYGQIVTVNLPSLTLFDQRGYQRIRQLLYLEYPPAAAWPSPIPIECDSGDDMVRFTPITDRDFYTEDVAASVGNFDYVRWFHDTEFGYANISTFEQSHVYRQIALDDLTLPEEVIQQQARSLRLFHLMGTEQIDLFQAAFDTVRDQALVNNLYSLSLVVDAEETLPGFIFSEANQQKRYWTMFKSLHPEFNPQWSSPFYVDAREI